MLHNKFAQKILITIRHILLKAKVTYLRKVYGMDINPTVRLSLKSILDKRNPKGIHIDEYSYVAFNAVILSHDMAGDKHADTCIGRCCFIGACSIILPGVKVGDHSIIAAGAVVSKDVPSHSIVAGNPAKVIRENIQTMEYGQIIKDKN